MKKTLGWLIAALVVIAAAAYAWVFWFAGGSGEPSTDLTTPELIGATTTTTGSSSTIVETATTAGPGDTGRSFVVDPARSNAVFVIDEILRGQPKTVVGTTQEVAGQFRIDPDDLASMQLSEFVINARTFETDSEQRNRAIRGPVILDSGSDEHELIVFTPTSVDGLGGATLRINEVYRFTITGDLTIKGVSEEVVFDVVAEMPDEDTIEGSATTIVERETFGIGIPNVPQVAGVDEEVQITLEFTAVAS